MGLRQFDNHKAILKPVDQNIATGVLKPNLVYRKDDVDKKKKMKLKQRTLNILKSGK